VTWLIGKSQNLTRRPETNVEHLGLEPPEVVCQPEIRG